MFSLVLLFAYLSLAIATPIDHARDSEGCSISLDFKEHKDLDEWQPLVLRDEKSLEIVYPRTDEPVLKLARNESVYLECPGKGNYININESRPVGVKAVCSKKRTFRVDKALYNFTSLACKFKPYHEAKRAGYCLDNDTLVNIGFELKGGFLPTIELCWDNRTYVTYWSKVHINKRIATYQSGYPRPSWLVGKFFKSIDVQKHYKVKEQISTLTKILKSARLAKKYVKPSVQFLSRGHLTAKVDFVYGALQSTTFWYLNAQPQWQSFNGGNWNTLEMNVRDFASKRNLDLIVYTGVHDQMTLRDVDGWYQPIYLFVDDKNKALPVPKFFWKLVYDPLSGRGIAFVGVNDPHRERITKSLYLCADISKTIKWLTWSPRDIELGVSYACEVDDLRKSVPTMPKLKVQGLLL